MPTIICSFCEYVGQGKEPEDRWHNAFNHEMRKHPQELIELYGPELFYELVGESGGDKNEA